MSETVVPTTSQLEALKRHIAATKALKIKRLGEFTETKLLIIQGTKADDSGGDEVKYGESRIGITLRVQDTPAISKRDLFDPDVI